MYIKRVFVRNFRNLKEVDVRFDSGLTCVVGENNSGKSNFLTALRLALDTNYSNYNRQLTKEDFTTGIDITNPEQVLVAVQFADFDSTKDPAKIKEHAFAQLCGIENDTAQICYRFRPKQNVRQAIENGEKKSTELIIEDYEWELVGGFAHDSSGKIKDLPFIDWKDDFSNGSIKANSLTAFRMVFLPAIRDVDEDLKRVSVSPLQKIFGLQEITEARRTQLVAKVKKVNDEMILEPEIVKLKQDIDSGFNQTVGSVFSMNVSLGMANPTFEGLARSLKMLLSGSGLNEADVGRNGLGINNALYISMLLKYFEKRLEKPDIAGELLLVEEPEAHLHPQLQKIIFGKLLDKKCQIIATTHSTHIASRSDLGKIIVFSPNTSSQTIARIPKENSKLSSDEVDDLQRYLDATKSVLLFAKRIVLVEGMSEVFLIPKLVKKIMSIDLEELGISVIPIHGVHFDCYMKLFGSHAIQRKCLVLTDGDLKPSDAKEIIDDDWPDGHKFVTVDDLKKLENDFVIVKNCKTTFERAITLHGNLKMFSLAAVELGAPNIGKLLLQYSKKPKLQDEELKEAKTKVLNTAKRFGKARFAQISSKYIQDAAELPKYIKDGIDWVVK